VGGEIEQSGGGKTHLGNVIPSSTSHFNENFVQIKVLITKKI
jgi:hypothetical protein